VRHGFGISGPAVDDEDQKLILKAQKIQSYWKKLNLNLPNIFKLVTEVTENSDKYYMEIHDLSKKELLIQSQGFGMKGGDGEFGGDESFDYGDDVLTGKRSKCVDFDDDSIAVGKASKKLSPGS
jgi:hypothetical protein